MNRAWIALAGLTALGAVALWHQNPNRAPLLVADSASPGECRAWHERARAQERHRKGWLAIFEGFSTLQGLCHPQDIARGRALIEDAIASGLDPTLAIDYTLALRKVGDVRAAEEWATLAAYVYVYRASTRGFLPWFDWSRFPAFKAEYRAFVTPRPWEKDLAELEHILSRPTKVPAAEAFAVFFLLGGVRQGDPTEAAYLTYRARAADREWGTHRVANTVNLWTAARCGHPEAIRRLGELVLANQLDESYLGPAITRVAWLHNRRTRQEGDLLVALLTKGGPQLWRRPGGEMVALFDQEIADKCPPRRTGSSPSFPGD